MGRLQTEELLRVFIPLDRNQQPEKCLMYSSPQWHLLDLNGTHGNVTEYHTQKCTDGWTYDNSKFKASTVTESEMEASPRVKWRQVPERNGGKSQSRMEARPRAEWRQDPEQNGGKAQSRMEAIPRVKWRQVPERNGGKALSEMEASPRAEWRQVPERNVRQAESPAVVPLPDGSVGNLRCVLLLLSLALLLEVSLWNCNIGADPQRFLPAWLPESARWLILNDKADVALEQLRRVAKINGKEAKGKNLTLEILKSSMKDEQLTAKNKHGVLDLFRTPVIRKIACCTMLAWFATGFAYYGLAIDLQGFGVDIYLIQFIFGAVDVPAKFIGFISMNLIGRRFTHSTSLILAGCVIVANIFVPKGEGL
ncbi:hypothetical protein chiPu_0019069 [Chiloscyllium punctatum]|uniref:Major facilitator superfamily (MFS) profile domain-containing protein n=1 Tax=Chiloscyllium punctatum TaxID=137246 RepID=A0A401RQL3_CHIPU|nr:hypothetical protein [Chiloscyllium punctatum]